MPDSTQPITTPISRAIIYTCFTCGDSTILHGVPCRCESLLNAQLPVPGESLTLTLVIAVTTVILGLGWVACTLLGYYPW